MSSAETDLYSDNPRIRFAAAQALMAPREDWSPEHLPTFVRDAVASRPLLGREVFGAANSWLLMVGPSPGGSPPGATASPFEDWTYPVDLGRPHRHFSYPDSAGFWKKIRLWSFEALQRGASIGSDTQALSVSMMMNLREEALADSSVLAAHLWEGTPRFWSAVEVTRPKLVVALTEDVFQAILLSLPGRGRSGAFTKHKVRQYLPRSCWVSGNNGASFLLARAPNHPSRQHPIPETYEYLGRLVGLAAAGA
jgi:hypothetical protein